MDRRDDFPRSSPFYKLVPSVEDVREFCRRYDIGDLVTVHGGLGGFLNVNLKVETTAGLYAIRVLSGFATVDHIRFTEQVIAVLREGGIPALKPLYTPAGVPFIRWNGRFVMVSRIAPGHLFRGRVRQARASGRMLRRFHDTLDNASCGPEPGWSDYPSERILGEGIERLRLLGLPADHLSEAERLHHMVASRWAKVCPDLPQTIIHGDWHPGNQLYLDGKVSCILDFDFVQCAERLHDVAYALWSLMPGNRSRSLSKAFLEGYGPLERVEQVELPLAIARAALFFICTASFTLHPDEELSVQLERQGPLIEWLLSTTGRRVIHGLLPLESMGRAA